MAWGELPDFDPRAVSEPWGHLLLCPQCLNAPDGNGLPENVHPHAVLVDRGGEIVAIEPDGPGFTQRPTQARGAIITLEMFCEQGHQFVLQLAFRKGATFFWYEPRQDWLTDTTDQLGGAWPGTLWRD